MDLRLEAALSGNLDAFEEGVRTAWMEAARASVETLRERGLDRLRGSMVEAGLGERLPNTWRAEIYPRRGLAEDPAVLFYSNAPEIVRAHEGATIRSAEGHWLAIPIPGSPADDFPVRGETRVEYARRKFGDRLFVIPARAGRLAILAAQNVSLTKTGRVTARQLTKTGKYGKNAATIFLFWLVPEVTLARRLDTDADFEWIAQTWTDEFPRLLAAELTARGLSG